MTFISYYRRRLKRLQSTLLQKDFNSGTELGLKSPSVYLRITIMLLTSSCLTALAFLSFAKTDEIVMAPGRLVPFGEVRNIQLPQGGVLKDLLVKNGEYVRKGQLLAKLDGEVSAELLRGVEDTIKSNRSELALKELEQKEYLETNSEEQAFARKSIVYIRLVLDRYIDLQSRGAIAELQVLEQQNLLDREVSRLATLKTDRKRQLSLFAQQKEKLKSDLQSLLGERAEYRYRNKKTSIVSSVNGIVFDVRPKDTLFVGQGTESIMKIVPDNKLYASVEVNADKIGFVRKNQSADISIDSFPASDFGVITGKVGLVGSDSLEPTQSSPFYRYPVEIFLSSQSLETKSHKRLQLKAGMSIVANIKLRRVSYLQLLLSDFQDKSDSLRSL